MVIGGIALIALGWFVSAALSLREVGKTLESMDSLVVGSSERPLASDAEWDISGGLIEENPEEVFSVGRVAPEVAAASRQPAPSSLYSITTSGIHAISGLAQETLTQEIERGENFSYMKSTEDFAAMRPFFERLRPDYLGDYASLSVRGTQVGFISGFAAMRGFEYFFVWVSPERPGYYIFMTNNDRMPVANLLGEVYSESAQLEFDQVGYTKSVY